MRQLEIILAEEAGFCFGVRRALEMAEQATREHERVHSLGPLIHNRQVVERLAEQGMAVCEDLEEIPAGEVAMVRAHGTGPETYERAQERGITLLDATCPFVGRVHQRARHFAEQGYQVLVLGEPDHPEAQGIVAHTRGQAVIVSSPEDLAGLKLQRRVAVVCQTTQTLDALQALVGTLRPQVQELVVANTICEATSKRQAAALEVAGQADLMLVVGGRHSANTRRLAEICAETGTGTRQVETAAEVEEEWLRGVERVGVTAGASTPPEAMAEVVARLQGIARKGEASP